MTKIRLVFTVFLVFSLSVSLLILLMIQGTPWDKYSVKKGALKYLNTKYNQEMETEKVYYSFEADYFVVVVHPVNNPEFKFTVRYFKSSKTFIDDYVRSLWEKEIESDIGNNIRKIFSNKASIRVTISGTQYDQYTSRIPSFKEIKANFNDEIRVNIRTNRKFDRINSDKEYKKVFDVIQLIREQGIRVDRLTLIFSRENQIDIFEFKYEDILSIAHPYEIAEYLE